MYTPNRSLEEQNERINLFKLYMQSRELNIKHKEIISPDLEDINYLLNINIRLHWVKKDRLLTSYLVTTLRKIKLKFNKDETILTLGELYNGNETNVTNIINILLDLKLLINIKDSGRAKKYGKFKLGPQFNSFYDLMLRYQSNTGLMFYTDKVDSLFEKLHSFKGVFSMKDIGENSEDHSQSLRILTKFNNIVLIGKDHGGKAKLYRCTDLFETSYKLGQEIKNKFITT